MRTQTAHAEAPQRCIGGGDEGRAALNRARPEEQAVGGAARAAHREAIRRRGAATRPNDGIGDGNAIELDATVANRLKAAVEPQPISLPRERRSEQHEEGEDVLHAPALRRRAR